MSLFSSRCASSNTPTEAGAVLLITSISLGLLEKFAMMCGWNCPWVTTGEYQLLLLVWAPRFHCQLVRVYIAREMELETFGLGDESCKAQIYFTLTQQWRQALILRWEGVFQLAARLLPQYLKLKHSPFERKPGTRVILWHDIFVDILKKHSEPLKKTQHYVFVEI